MTTNYSWHDFYKAALLETDWTKVEERIQTAESEIQKRMACFLRITAEHRKKGKLSPMP